VHQRTSKGRLRESREIYLNRSDLHNFGRAVTQIDFEFLHKPRSIFWEWLFLGNSPLRSILNSNCEDLFGSLPDLKFESNDYSDGLVEICTADPIESLEQSDLIQTGAILGLMSFFGISDLHKDNVIYGSVNGQYVFSPLDIESVFDDIQMPAQTLLLPSRLIKENHCGLTGVLRLLAAKNYSLDSLVPLAYGYAESLDFLMRNTKELFIALDNLIATFHPSIRSVLRPTSDYYKFFNPAHSLSPPLDQSETIQISRGDIPYFFKHAIASEVFCYIDPALTQKKTIAPHQITSKTTIENLTISQFRNSIPERVQTLTTAGLLQVLRLLPNEIKSQKLQLINLTVEATRSEILVTRHSKSFKCQRIKE
jgi:hypothetical protein